MRICEWIEIHDRFAVCMCERIEVQGCIIEVVFVYRRNEQDAITQTVADIH